MSKLTLGSDSSDVSAEALMDEAVLSAVVIAELTESLYVVSMISEIFTLVGIKRKREIPNITAAADHL